MRNDLEGVLSALDQRAASDSGLERYRVTAVGAAALAGIPVGWFVSDAIERIAVRGGWWPGEWMFPVNDEIVTLVIAGQSEPHPAATIRWLGVGSVWERDGFWTPAAQERFASAPLFGFSNQALWSSMVFPTEAALLKAFLVTYDELGLDENGEINPYFVEWVTSTPSADAPPGAARVHERLAALSRRPPSDHPCWLPLEMSALTTSGWSPRAVSAILGTDTGE